MQTSPTAATGLQDISTYGWIEVHAVPEPGTWAFMIGGLLVAGTLVRRRAAHRRW